jgi:hypothetical protein
MMRFYLHWTLMVMTSGMSWPGSESVAIHETNFQRLPEVCLLDATYKQEYIKTILDISDHLQIVFVSKAFQSYMKRFTQNKFQTINIIWKPFVSTPYLCLKSKRKWFEIRLKNCLPVFVWKAFEDKQKLVFLPQRTSFEIRLNNVENICLPVFFWKTLCPTCPVNGGNWWVHVISRSKTCRTWWETNTM